ncbi:MAG: starch phosphorylase, partial [Colwellia sp.]
MINKKIKSSTADITATELKKRIQHHLNSTLGDRVICEDAYKNTPQNKQAYWQATSMALNEIIIDKLQASKVQQAKSATKSINYLSLEYLMGRLLSNNLHNLDLYKNTEKALKSLGFDLADLCEEGADLALGNGGLGRLAACFLDSLATLDYNAMGYGIHYQHGLFKQS